MSVNVLLSFAFFGRGTRHGTDDLGAYRVAMPCGRIMFDSGAFTAASIGQKVTLDGYADFLTTWRHVWDHAVTLDVIGDPAATRRNTHRLHQRGFNVMPVFTRNDTPAAFDAMVRDSGYVCVGGGVGMPPPLVIDRLSALQRRAEELGGGIHALGVGNLAGLRRIRPYSADASNVSASFLHGTLITYDGRKFNTFPVSDRKRLRQHADGLRAQGLQVADLARTGRQPIGGEPRSTLMRGLSLAYAAADEDTVRFGVPVPQGVTDSPGTHLYSSVVGQHLAPAATGLDTLIHDGDWTAPLWERYRARHAVQCRARAPA